MARKPRVTTRWYSDTEVELTEDDQVNIAAALQLAANVYADLPNATASQKRMVERWLLLMNTVLYGEEPM
jgi:hypothetical protein